jgi:hypothetical protein
VLTRLALGSDFAAMGDFFAAAGKPEALVEHVADAVRRAARAGQGDQVRRLLGLLEDHNVEELDLLLPAKVIQAGCRPGQMLRMIEQEALRLLDGPMVVEMAHSLIHLGCPALGILVGRGVIPHSHFMDAQVLLAVILETRDRLGLPPEDPAEELYESRLFTLDQEEEDDAILQQLHQERQQLTEKIAEVLQLRRRIIELQHDLAQRRKVERQTLPNTVAQNDTRKAETGTGAPPAIAADHEAAERTRADRRAEG